MNNRPQAFKFTLIYVGVKYRTYANATGPRSKSNTAINNTLIFFTLRQDILQQDANPSFLFSAKRQLNNSHWTPMKQCNIFRSYNYLNLSIYFTKGKIKLLVNFLIIEPLSHRGLHAMYINKNFCCFVSETGQWLRKWSKSQNIRSVSNNFSHWVKESVNLAVSNLFWIQEDQVNSR